MTERPIIPVILSGGSGSRLWPASRSKRPKQLLPLVDERTMFLTTVQRADALPHTTPPLVVCNEDHLSGIRQELAADGHRDAPVILEPVGRNTAPATAAAALRASADGSDPLLFVMPADHVIRNEEAFAEAVALAARFADNGYLITFGIEPSSPETGYGYIRYGERLADGVRVVDAFKEKPDAVTAEEYLASGHYLWNSGMFMFRASRFLDELSLHAPGVLAATRAALEAADVDGPVVRLDRDAFAAAPSISIDYAVMEHTDAAAVIPMHAGWSDVGSWAARWDIGHHDGDGFVVKGDVETIDVHRSYLRSNGRLLAAIGLEDVVIVDTPDVTLVARKDRSEDVKEIVDRLKEADRPEVVSDGGDVRPWGGFAALASGPGYRVLRLTIKPGEKLSLQTHEHRSEHWIVVRGTARIRIGETTRLVPEHESVFIPAREVHRLENASHTDILEVIEVDVGSYVGEDDLKRYVDAYGRAKRQG
jgi:mannose-1-phosphate guanylyltransferase/mannose-6-phosphate isomerase